MFVRKNRHAPELSAANYSAKLSYSKKYLSSDVSTFCSLAKKIFTVLTPKPPKNHQRYATAATKKKDVATKRLHAHTINVQTVTVLSRQTHQ